jgi:hypothetical protein
MNVQVFLNDMQFNDNAEQKAPASAASPSAAASHLVLAEGLCLTATVLVVPADQAAINGFAWGTDASQPAFAQTCAKYSVTPEGVATQLFP